MGGKRTHGEFWTKHAVERAATRYPDLTEDDFRQIVRAVCDGKALKMKVSGDGIGLLMHHNGQRIAMVVDIDQRLIITFLPPDYYSSGQLAARKTWRSRTDRKFPADFSERRGKGRAKARLRALEME